MTNTSKFSHRVIAMFLTFTFLPSLFPINFVFASNAGPTAPEATSFEPVDATDMVSLATGDLSYVLPLLNVPSPEGGYPLALSYHAGIGIEQEASWVGLGWNLNPGALNRNVNGVPDDWLETRKYNMMYNNLGVAKSISLGVTNFGGYFTSSWAINSRSYQAMGGERTHDIGISSSVDALGQGINNYIGTDGTGFGISFGLSYGGFSISNGISLFQGFNGEGLSANASKSISGYGFGVDFDLSSSGNLSTSMSVAGAKIGVGNKLNPSIYRDISGSQFHIFLGPNLVSYTNLKTKFFSFDANFATYNGSLYAGKIEDSYQNVLDIGQMGLDSYIAVYESDKDEQLKRPGYSYMSYDGYEVNAQGIGGTIAPKLLEEGTLIMPRTATRINTSSSGAYQTPQTLLTHQKPDDANKNFSKSLENNSVHFYFDNEYSSFLKIGSGTWSAPSPTLNYMDPTVLSTTGSYFDDQTTANGNNYDSYNESMERLRKGRFIQTYTNKEINQNPNLIIAPSADGFDRTDGEVPEAGIGAFKVIAMDGKTYHYSLPVYQKAQFTRIFNTDEDSGEKFLEEQQFEPYATHWLLTAVTGADYVDYNGNHQVDEGDYGYWVEFDYGKWSDGFAWKSPYGGNRSNGSTDQYSWGIKEVYYLDKVVTRTHTALFIKDIRSDATSYRTVIADGANPKHYTLPFQRSFFRAGDGNYYSQGPHLAIDIPYPPHYYNTTSEFWFYADLARQKSLRLEKIILIKNEDASGITKSNTTDSESSAGGRLYANAKISRDNTVTGQHLGSISGAVADDHTWYSEFYNNILNTRDIELNTLMPKSLKTIDFTYDPSYSLGNKYGNEIGKLTLDAVDFLGKGGARLIPPYEFGYYHKNSTYQDNDMDDWGYYKNFADFWSLDEIITPLGGKIEIDYENDRYVDEYSRPTTFFDHGLQFKFEGTSSGSKTISFRNDPSVSSEYHIDFTDYFVTGSSAEIDVLYWHFTHTESNWIADIAANCQVQSVAGNLLVFSLPNSNKTWGREYENCHEQNWVYYDNQYGHVVDETVDWYEAKNENSCQRPVEGDYRTRYKLFAQKEPLNASIGGGVRVKEIKATGDSPTVKTVYSYLDEEGQESGVTSYAPSIHDRVVPYITELPAPMVIYENVTVSKKDAQDNTYLRKSYKFNVPKPIQHFSNGVLVENAFRITKTQNDSYEDISVEGEDVDMVLSKFEVLDLTASIGRLESVGLYNANGQLLSYMDNTYLPSDHDFKQGVLQESFTSYRRLQDYPLKDKYFMTTSSKQKIPNVLSKSVLSQNGISRETEYLEYDFLTGRITGMNSSLSNGNRLRTVEIPAYSIPAYEDMGSKADNPSNKNMLTQEALSYTEVGDGNDWNKIGADVTTWQDVTYSTNEWVGTPPNQTTLTTYHDIWRKHKSYTWNGNTDANGSFQNYSGVDDGFDWVNDNNSGADWKQLSEITRYNNYSMPLEVKDINGNYAATKMGYDDSRILAVGNAGYGEMFYSGAEDHNGQGMFGGGVQKGTATIQTTYAHTGESALQIGSGQSGFRVTVDNGLSTSKSFKISLWAKYDTYGNVRINAGGTILTHKVSEEVRAGDWVQLNFYVNLSDQSQVFVTSSGGNVIVDDFRLHPIFSSMTSYVYNQWDELSYILGQNNMAIHYEYDQMGRLVKTFTEVGDFAGAGSGGFKKSNENKYTYKY